MREGRRLRLAAIPKPTAAAITGYSLGLRAYVALPSTGA